MSSCPRVSGRARSSRCIRFPYRNPLSRGQPLAQTLRPYVSPVLFDVVHTRCAIPFAIHHPPAGWNIGEGGPQAVLLLVVYQDEKTAVTVVERIDAHRVSRRLLDMGITSSRPYWSPLALSKCSDCEAAGKDKSSVEITCAIDVRIATARPHLHESGRTFALVILYPDASLRGERRRTHPRLST